MLRLFFIFIAADLAVSLMFAILPLLLWSAGAIVVIGLGFYGYGVVRARFVRMLPQSSVRGLTRVVR